MVPGGLFGGQPFLQLFEAAGVKNREEINGYLRAAILIPAG